MKPLKLTMEAFGSYADRTVIDFSVPNQNLFLITGDTGSGKSTVFDAIVFVLYGQAGSSMNKKDGQELQSQFADLAVKPVVELIFAEGSLETEEIYTVRRSPRYVRPLLRGSGTKDEKETVCLLLPDGSDYAANKAQTDRKIEEIVGLTKEQFMQVAMIAQGEFMEVLRAGTKEKKEIFRKLFHTEPYQQMVEKLQKRVQDKKKDMDQIYSILTHLCSRIQVPEEMEGAEALSALLSHIQKEKELAITDFEEVQRYLEQILKTQQDMMQKLQKELQQAKSQNEKTQEALTRGRALSGTFLSLEKAEQKEKQLQNLQEEMAKKEKLAKQIEAAYALHQLCKDALEAGRILKTKQDRLRILEEQAPELVKAEDAAAQEEQRAAKEKQVSDAAHAAMQERVQLVQTRKKDIDDLTQEAAAIRKECNRLDAQAAEDKQQLEEQQKQLTELTLTLETHKQADAAYQVWESRQGEEKRLEKERTDLQAAYRKTKDTYEQYAKARKTFEDRKNSYQVIEQAYGQINAAFYDAQAGILAKEKLIQGQPCPVCGSREHPSPAVLAEEMQSLTKEVLDQKKKQRDLAEQEMSKWAQLCTARKQEYDENLKSFQADLSALRTDLQAGEPEKDKSYEQQLLELGELLNRRQQSYAQQGQLLKEQKDLYHRAEQQKKQTEETLGKLQKTNEERLSYRQKKQVEEASADARLKQLMEQAKEDAKVLKEEARLREQQVSCDKAYTQAKENHLKAGRNKAASDREIASLREQLPAEEAGYRQKKERLETAQADFALTQDEMQTLVETHEEKEALRLKEQLNSYQEACVTTRSAIKTAKETIGEQEKPDEEVLQAQAVEATAIYEEKQQAASSLQYRLQQNTDLKNQLTDILEKRSKSGMEYSRIKNLYDRLAGKVSGSRMDLETYVQRYHLERILHAANSRFYEMSGGQYELRMMDVTEAGEGKNKGLDLMVYSTITDTIREVRTLSGGESFMAALSLALGIADRIEEASAALHLDMMFIDEGFGSLDDHARSSAIKVLQQMAGGSKLIGIISHVSELRTEMEDQLIVTKDKQGSHVKWQIS